MWGVTTNRISKERNRSAQSIKQGFKTWKSNIKTTKLVQNIQNVNTVWKRNRKDEIDDFKYQFRVYVITIKGNEKRNEIKLIMNKSNSK